MKPLLLDEEIDITLNENEKWHLSFKSPKQTELYLMKKFINCYRNAHFHCKNHSIGGTQTECFMLMNEMLIENGYKPKKHVSTVTKLWDLPFESYEWPYYDEMNYG
ncbi:hypothetical protein P4646_19945 [Peribacillus simplex]|uniref:hypothetical protein n=1 Tax=Peribacillus simplex TaxID=1478 RepID=UPI002E1FD275|nr:hypothetical protein [Peribacillus simplex]MED4096822.1 hypothetical protein [Peribacillus simplex]